MPDDPALHIFPDEFVPNVEASLAYKHWAKSSPADTARWAAFRDALLAGVLSPPIPAMSTKFGKALVAAGKEHMSITRFVGQVTNPYPPPDPVPPGASWPSTFTNGPAGANNILPSVTNKAFLGVAQADGAGEPPVATQIAALESYIGRTLNIEHRFFQGTSTIDTALIATIVARGHIPMISWFPTPSNGGEIIAGNADAGIRSVGQQIGSQPHRIFLRICWEFNGTWYPFSRDTDGSLLSDTEHRTMFRRIVDKLREGGIGNKASIVWCPDEGYYGNGDFFDETIAYPGDDYVDWVGSDGYNGGGYCGNHAGWCTYPEIYTHGRCLGGSSYGVQCSASNTPVGTEKDFRGRKPFMVAETGTIEGLPGQKGDWHRQVRDYIKNYQPGCYAFVYFDVDVRLYGEGNNWKLDTSSDSLQGFRDLALDPHFNP